MAGRPPKTTADYFPHDAVPGKTLFILQSRFGNNGYAGWYKLLALLCRSTGHVYSYSKPADWQFLQAEMAFPTIEMLNDFLLALAELEAIDPTLYLNKILWSQNLVNRLSPIYDNRHQSLPLKPISMPNNTTITPISMPNNTTITPISMPNNTQTKLKETKLKETKLKETKLKTPLLPTPPVPVAAAASFEGLKNNNGLFTELATKFPMLDLNDELYKCQLWWSASRKTVKSPELAFRNWLSKALEIQTERKVPQKERGKSGYTGMKND